MMLRRFWRIAATAGLAASLTWPAASLLADTPTAQATSPYAGLADRRIKALSEDEIADLLAGRGMRLALAAELNGYPGPAHVLELAEGLSLTPQQVAATTALEAEMAREATRLGAEIVEREAALDRLFASGGATPESVQRDVAELARLQGALRSVHLTTHLSMRAILAPEQVAAYARLRGYGAPNEAGHGHGNHAAH